MYYEFRHVMKVGIDAHTVGSRSSGNESYYLQLLRNFAGNGGADQYVIYFTHMSAMSQIPIAGNFHPRRIRPANPFIRIPISFPIEFQRTKLDVFHAQFIIPPLSRCKTVTTIPDIAYEHFPEFFTSTQVAWSKVLIRSSASRADHILTVSNFSKDDLVQRYHIDPEKITVTYEGAGNEFHPREKGAAREHLARKYNLQFPFILYVGRLQTRKNLIRLVEAYARLRKGGAEQKLVMVGRQDSGYKEIVERLRSLGLNSDVTLTGYVPAEDLPVFFSAAEVFVYPSVFEGFGLPLIEAMACGTPVVTSFGSSLEEVAGDAALLADPHSVDSIADAMSRVLGDPQLQKELSSRGLARASQFSWHRTALQTIGVYKHLLS